MIDRLATFIVTVALATTAGCSTAGGFNTLKATAEQACMQQPPSERDACRARIYPGDHKAYERERTAP